MSLVLGHVGQNVGKIGLHIQFCSFFVTLLSNYLPAAGWQIPKITLIAGADACHTLWTYVALNFEKNIVGEVCLPQFKDISLNFEKI